MLNSILAAFIAAAAAVSPGPVVQGENGGLQPAQGTYVYAVSVTPPAGHAYSLDLCQAFTYNLATLPSPAPFLAGGAIKSAAAKVGDGGACVATITVLR
ncbi:MAG: hypothetical protein HY804_08910 [Nitrospinae bacterium]|nr:hypothetical protein [Nitrospinota bacterium]